MKDVSAISSYNAILGEMRAYADLLRIQGWNVESSGPGAKGPDFSITSQNGIKFVVEVFSYPPRPDNVILVDPPRTTYFNDVQGNKCSITSSISVEDPFGFPDLSKAGDSTTANAISKICARKGSEYQFSDAEVSILYLDLQSVPISWTMIEQLDPILKSNDTITSGGVWMAYYGRKGYPIFENASPWNHRPQKCVLMGHDGHFYQSQGSKLSAVIVATGYDEHDGSACRLGVLENEQRPLPDAIRKDLMRSNLFDVHSRCLSKTSLVRKLKEDRNEIYRAAIDVLGEDRASALAALLS